jgi:peptidoglycan/xylan/chitin deacetylase (PgdA/CDA1 family)
LDAQIIYAPERSSWLEMANWAAIRAASAAGVVLHELFGSRAHGLLAGITYHRTAPRYAGVPLPTQNVTPERFREQLTGLLRRGFNFWPLSRVLEYRNQGLPVPPQTVVLTFDDGYATVHEYAWPVLRELGLPATVFLATGYLDSEAPFPWDTWANRYRDRLPPKAYRPLTVAECREMTADSRVEMGAHTTTHQDFRCRPQEFLEDLRESVEFIRLRFGRQEAPFAYCYGSPYRGFAGDDLAAVAREAGAACGLTTESVLFDLRSDPFRWGRFNVFPWDTSAMLAAKLGGWFTWAQQLRHRLFRSTRNVR